MNQLVVTACLTVVLLPCSLKVLVDLGETFQNAELQFCNSGSKSKDLVLEVRNHLCCFCSP